MQQLIQCVEGIFLLGNISAQLPQTLFAVALLIGHFRQTQHVLLNKLFLVKIVLK